MSRRTVIAVGLAAVALTAGAGKLLIAPREIGVRRF